MQMSEKESSAGCSPKPWVMTQESISEYLRFETDRGASEAALRTCRRVVNAVYKWLPEDKVLTKALLLSWRQSLKEHGYSSEIGRAHV